MGTVKTRLIFLRGSSLKHDVAYADGWAETISPSVQGWMRKSFKCSHDCVQLLQKVSNFSLYSQPNVWQGDGNISMLIDFAVL